MKLILCMHFILLFPLTHGGNLKQYDSKTPSVNWKKKKEEKKTWLIPRIERLERFNNQFISPFSSRRRN